MSTTFNKANLLPLVMKLGDYFKKGFDHYVQMKAAGVEVDAELLSAFVSMQMDRWDPKIGGKEIFDSSTKQACARFVGGVVFNLAK